MSNSFYTVSGTPSQGSFGSSAAVRSEFAAIAAGFDKMPALTAGTAVVANPGGTGLTNTVGALALAGNFAITGAFSTTLVASAGVTLTLPGVDATLVGRGTTDTLLNKTLTSPTINGGTFSGTISGAHTYSGALTLSAALTGTAATFSGNITQARTAADSTSIVATTTINNNAITQYSDGTNLWNVGLQGGSVASDGVYRIGKGGPPMLALTAGGDLSISGVLSTNSYTVATLPTGGDGKRAFVTDANATTYASNVAGSGSNHVPVFYSSATSTWKIG